METDANIPAVLRGAASIQEALDVIGNDKGLTDKDLAKIVVDNELPIRELLRFALERVTER